MIILVIGRIVLMKRYSSAGTKAHECSGGVEMPTKDLDECKDEDGTSVGGELDLTSNLSISNISRDDVWTF